jgi:HD-GYP domain-containing protein (c-di-GMP phosphodiesterase class II)
VELDVDGQSYEAVSSRLKGLHDQIREVAPDIDRVACALYDADDDLLKTFINSTRGGTVLRAYQYRLSDSESLSAVAATGQARVLNDLPAVLSPTTAHSAYVLEEGYQSSLTVPMHYLGGFLGFIFFDSRVPDTFTPQVQRQLLLYSNLITLGVANELIAVRSIVGTVQISRHFTELRDCETGAHLERMSRYARLVSRALADELGLSDEFIEHVYLYAPLHDIGKVGIPDRILLKPGPLDPDEWEVMKTHTTIGHTMVDNISRDLRIDRLPDDWVLRNIVLHHHEALDGSGYPDGLAGEEIPLESRIVSVADVFDALTSTRPYKQAWDVDAAVAELTRMVGAGKLDGRCVRALVSEREAIEEIRQRHREAA